MVRSNLVISLVPYIYTYSIESIQPSFFNQCKSNNAVIKLNDTQFLVDMYVILATPPNKYFELLMIQREKKVTISCWMGLQGALNKAVVKKGYLD